MKTLPFMPPKSARKKPDWISAFLPTEIINKIRAFNPFPGCTANFPRITPLKIWKAVASDHSPAAEKAGQILSADENGIVGRLRQRIDPDTGTAETRSETIARFRIYQGIFYSNTGISNNMPQQSFQIGY